MKIAVRYYSKSGNTKKVAEAIASQVGVKAEDVNAQLNEDVDILFLGGAPYAATLGKELRDFISGIKVKVGIVVPFSTSALLSNNRMLPKFEAACKKSGLNCLNEEFNCKGKFLHLHTTHPDNSDLESAKKWAQSIIDKR